MKKTATVLAALATGAAAIAISIAPPAAADSSNCQTVNGATVCGQGNVRGSGGQSGSAPQAPGPAPAGGGCKTPYGTWQNCNAGGGGG
jgi:hypothetical protein